MIAHRFMTLVKATVLCVAVAGLAACASSGKKNNAYGEAGSLRGSPEVQGLGSDDEFSGGKMFTSTKDEDGRPILQKTFYFPFDSSTVSAADRAALDKISEFMKRYPKVKVRLEGNTDERGSRVYNIGLGERRASAIADILRTDGVSKGQMTTVSYGAEQPVALGHTEQDYRLNRRVDIILPRS